MSQYDNSIVSTKYSFLNEKAFSKYSKQSNYFLNFIYIYINAHFLMYELLESVQDDVIVSSLSFFKIRTHFRMKKLLEIVPDHLVVLRIP